MKTDNMPDKAIHQMTVPIMTPDRRSRARVWLYRLMGKPMPPEPEATRTLTFYPSVVVNASRIVAACMLLPDEIWDQVYLNLPLLLEHQPRIVYIVAAALQNNHLEPAPKLIKFLEYNLSGEQLSEALSASIQALGLESFLRCVLLLKPAAKILKPDTMPEETVSEDQALSEDQSNLS